MKTIVLLVLALGVSRAQALAAGCADDPKNLLAKLNCDFEKDVRGWTPWTGTAQTVSHDPGSGDSKPGALKGGDAEGSLSIVGPCFKVRPSTTYRSGARLQTAAGTPYVCALNTYAFSDSACQEGADALAGEARPPEKAWTSITKDATTGAKTASAQLRLDCSGEPGFKILFDDIFFREP